MKNKKKNDFCLLHKHISNVIILLKNTHQHCEYRRVNSINSIWEAFWSRILESFGPKPLQV